MKYIKSYENNNIKKYFVINFKKRFEIYKLLAFTSGVQECKRIFRYYKNDKNLINDELIISLNLLNEDRIIYSSDDLNDILNNLSSLENLNKYNL